MIEAAMIDSREPEWVQSLTFGGVPASVIMLDQGDLMLACKDSSIILVERKTPDDFLGSLKDNRLFNQLANMLDVTRWSYLVITGEFQRNSQTGHAITARGDTGWAWSSIQGALLTAQELGVFVIQAASDLDYEDCIKRIAQRERKPEMVIAPAKFPHVLTIQEQVVAALPGIGLDRLQAVMAHCGTPAWSLVALTDKETVIPGVGAGIKAKVRSALGLKDSEQMAVSLDDQGNETIVIASLGAQ